ncbi:hypothetical protein [Streptomyces sp. NBC_00989]|uniref:hypothetical protein n=1 Tax=Streptomyces sp. NBC_00989 TaxID=2903705 RepID=UPI003866EA5F|nr:hypothetical protein OG714_43495 [Streptomyces sp. NBC_00989]
MNRIGIAAVRRTRTTALTVAAAAVAGLVWAGASSAGPADTTSATVSTSTAELADTVGFAATDQRPLPAWMPPELRADLRKLRTMKPGQRQQAAARIWQDALAGEYGTAVRVRAEEARRRYQALPEELRDDIKELSGLSGDQRSEKRTEIRDKALAGEYGEQVQGWAERRSDFWQQG